MSLHPEFEHDLTLFDLLMKKPTQKEQAEQKRLSVTNKKLRQSMLRRKQKIFATIETKRFDPMFWEKPCLQVDGSRVGLWVDANGQPQPKDNRIPNDGLLFVKVDLDRPFDVRRMAELAHKAQAKHSVLVNLRCYFAANMKRLRAKSVREDVFGDGVAISESIIFEYHIATKCLKVYQPPHMDMIDDLSQECLVYANKNGCKTSDQAVLKTWFDH